MISSSELSEKHLQALRLAWLNVGRNSFCFGIVSFSVHLALPPCCCNGDDNRAAASKQSKEPPEAGGSGSYMYEGQITQDPLLHTDAGAHSQ